MKRSFGIAVTGILSVVLCSIVPALAQEAIPRDSTEAILNHVRQLQQTLNLDQQQTGKISDIFQSSVLKESEIFDQLEKINRTRDSEVEKILKPDQLQQLKKNGLPGILGTHDARGYGRNQQAFQRAGKAGMSSGQSLSGMVGVSSDQLEEIGRLVLEERMNANQALDRVLAPQQKTLLKRAWSGKAGSGINTGKGKNTQRPSGSGVLNDGDNDSGAGSGNTPTTRDTGTGKKKGR